MIGAIFATDMSHHFTLKAELDAINKRRNEARSARIQFSLRIESGSGSGNKHSFINNDTNNDTNTNNTTTNTNANGTDDAKNSKENDTSQPSTSTSPSPSDQPSDQPPLPYVFTEKERECILCSLLHGSDISNPAKGWAVSKQWSDRVCQEFFSQGDREKAEGMPGNCIPLRCILLCCTALHCTALHCIPLRCIAF
jgi:hypothetical protein